MQTTQIQQMTKELADANEELAGWRSGSIRLANQKQWREERASRQLPINPSVSKQASVDVAKIKLGEDIPNQAFAASDRKK